MSTSKVKKKKKIGIVCPERGTLLGCASQYRCELKEREELWEIKEEGGDKGEKGESAKASQASVVPQTNWKQCVWKSASGADNGKIKVIRIRIINKTLQRNFIPF